MIAIKKGQKKSTKIRSAPKRMESPTAAANSMKAATRPGKPQSPVYAATIVAETNRMAATTDMIPRNKKIARVNSDACTLERHRRKFMCLATIGGLRVRQTVTSPNILQHLGGHGRGRAPRE